MDVHCRKAGTIERRSHLHVGVDPLLAQHRQTGGDTTGNIGRSHILRRVVTELGMQTRIGGVLTGGVLLIGTRRVVTQTLHLPAGLAPDGAQRGTTGAIEFLTRTLQGDEIPLAHCAKHVGASRQTVTGQQGHHRLFIFAAYLNDGAQLFVEQRWQQLAADAIELDVEAAVTGKRHLGQGNEQATIGAVVIGDQFAIGHQRLNGVEEALELDWIVEIRRLVTQLAINLR